MKKTDINIQITHASVCAESSLELIGIKTRKTRLKIQSSVSVRLLITNTSVGNILLITKEVGPVPLLPFTQLQSCVCSQKYWIVAK